METITKTIDERLYGLFEELRDKPARKGPPTKKVALISTPRCGSKFFCETLAGTGKFGYPAEWVNPSYINAYVRVFRPANLNLAEYFDFIVSRTTSENGLFALNFHVNQYVEWQKQGIDLLTIGFDRIYGLRRKDKLAQALSYAKAEASGQWRASDKPQVGTAAARITMPMIIEALHRLSRMDEFYETHLEKFVHQHFFYEDFSTDASCFHEVLRDCGVDHREAAGFACDMQIQRGESDRELLDRLRAYLGCGLPGR